MHCILCSGEVLLASRIPSAFYKIFMALSRACRLLFRPMGVSEADIQSIDNDLKIFVTSHYDTAGRPSGYRSACRQSHLFWTLFRCSERAAQPGSSGSFRWNGKLGRWKS